MTSERRRYVVLGAGGIGCALGGMLQRSGASVAFIARGAQLDALRDHGLTIMTPSRAETLSVTVAASPAELRVEPNDIILLCVKSQDTASAIADLAASAPSSVPVICAQNGVGNERVAASAFPHVYGLMVFSPVSFLEPGRIAVHSEPVLGGLDLGIYPEGADDLTRHVARDLTAAGFDARVEPRILRLKYGKLLSNLANAVQALSGARALIPELLGPLRDEAIAAYRAAGVDFAPLAEVYARNANIVDLPVQGRPRGGGSTWQSLARGTGSIEVDALNGEIAALGDSFGVPTPLNHALVSLARRAATERWPPERLSVDELRAALFARPNDEDRA